MSGTAELSDLAIQVGSGPRWAMVRTYFGISAFGVNAYIADEPGVTVVSEHDEVTGGHEELYFVGSGHATFTVDGDEIDAPAGTFVFVRDPAAKRKAVAKEGGTAIVIAGAKPGEAFKPSNWERQAPALVHFSTKEYDKAIEALEGLLAETPEDAGVLYNLACAESLNGNKQQALEHLRRSVELDPSFGELAKKDSDFAAIRDAAAADDAEFASAIAGQPDAGGSSS
jgi:tetratricopeptide (TPR) repeat protein